MRYGHKPILAMSADLSGTLSEQRGRNALNKKGKAIGARRQMQAARVGTHTGATPPVVPVARPARNARGRGSLPCVSLQSCIRLSAARTQKRPAILPAGSPGARSQ